MKNEGMGPIATPEALDRIDKLVQKSISQGAELAMGGKRPEGAEFEKGNWYEPTVLLNATAETEAAKESINGRN